MKTAAAILAGLPVIQLLRARVTFKSVSSVVLGDWKDLHLATAWCDAQWKKHKHGYVRHVDAVNSTACFDLADETDAVFFKLRFG
jgi:hypothetical protein